MTWTKTSLVVVVAGLAAACGEDGGRGDSASASATATATVTATVSASEGSTTLETPTGSASEGESSGGSVSDSLTGSTGGTTVEVTATGTGSTTEAVTGTDSDPGTGTDSAPGTSTGMPADMGDPCGGGPGEPDVSYIWIANSSQGTISKIDTQTLQEKGRYIVRPDSAGSPSRTSVNLSGDVVVANREGGMAKVYARVIDCVESNGMPGIQTSTDSNVLPWGVEECVAWYTPMNYISQRPAAWTPGTFNKQSCAWENQKVWSSGVINGQQGVDIVRLNGQTGVIEDKINIPTINHGFYGIYGAAVDAEGNMWGSQLGQGQLLFVDHETLEYKTWPMAASGYGMTVGASGYVWTCSGNASRFDPMTETWQTVGVGGSGGCMEDDKGTLYMASSPVVAIDVETLQVKATYPLPQYVHGISIDYYGYVWGVSLGSQAYRIDVANPGAFQTFNGLIGAYTYSDMTGVALSNVSPQ